MWVTLNLHAVNYTPALCYNANLRPKQPLIKKAYSNTYCWFALVEGINYLVMHSDIMYYSWARYLFIISVLSRFVKQSLCRVCVTVKVRSQYNYNYHNMVRHKWLPSHLKLRTVKYKSKTVPRGSVHVRAQL